MNPFVSAAFAAVSIAIALGSQNATLGQKWRIATYQIEAIERAGDVERIAAILIGESGERLGRYERFRTLRARPTGEPTSTHTIREQVVNERTQLEWMGDTLSVETDHSTGAFNVTYNGTALGTVVAGRPPDAGSPVGIFIERHGDLLTIADDIGRDVARLLAQRPVSAEPRARRNLKTTIHQHRLSPDDAIIQTVVWSPDDRSAGAAETIALLKGSYTLFASGDTASDEIAITIGDKGSGASLGEFTLGPQPHADSASVNVPAPCICLVTATPGREVRSRAKDPYYIAIGFIRHSSTASELGSVLAVYATVQNDLAQDRFDGTRWPSEIVRLVEKLAGAAGRDAVLDLTSATDIRHARAAFERVSEALIPVFVNNQASEVRVFVCPMNRKRWMQSEKSPRNPYYGRLMSDCGHELSR